MRHELILAEAKEVTFKEIDSGKDPYPRIIEIHPTDVCNQACKYCFHSGNGFGESRDPTRYLNAQQLNRFVGDISDLGIKELSISGGGEPFLSEDIRVLLAEAKSKDINIRIVTNGNFIPEGILSDIVSCTEIRFSIDTVDPETYASIRNVKPSLLNVTLNNIKRVVLEKRERKTNIQIGATFIINPQNQEQISDFASLLLGKIGIDKVIYKYDIYGRYVPHGDQTRIKKSLLLIKKHWGDGVDVRNSLGDFVSGSPCVVPYFKSVVNPYGDVYSCCLGSQPGEINGFFLGNVTQDLKDENNNSFAQVWKKSKSIRDEMLKGVRCVDCNFTDREINESYVSFHK